VEHDEKEAIVTTTNLQKQQIRFCPMCGTERVPVLANFCVSCGFCFDLSARVQIQKESDVNKVISKVTNNMSSFWGNIKGRVVPSSVKREGFISKYDDQTWTDYYFVLREGHVHALTHPEAPKADVSLPLTSVKKIERLDPLTTGRSFSFKTKLFITDSATAQISTVAFFGMSVASTETVVGREIDLIFSLPTEQEMDDWIRDLSSATTGQAIRDHLKNTGEGAMRLMETTFVGTAAFTVARRAGLRLANKIIK